MKASKSSPAYQKPHQSHPYKDADIQQSTQSARTLHHKTVSLCKSISQYQSCLLNHRLSGPSNAFESSSPGQIWFPGFHCIQNGKNSGNRQAWGDFDPHYARGPVPSQLTSVDRCFAKIPYFCQGVPDEQIAYFSRSIVWAMTVFRRDGWGERGIGGIAIGWEWKRSEIEVGIVSCRGPGVVDLTFHDPVNRIPFAHEADSLSLMLFYSSVVSFVAVVTSQNTPASSNSRHPLDLRLRLDIQAPLKSRNGVPLSCVVQ
jgi:hypothetical protein